MGLLDDTYAKSKALAGLLADAYQTGAQAYFPNEEDVKARPELAKGLLQFVPGPGDAISGYDALQSAKQGNYGEAALNGIGLLPFVPAMGGMINGGIKQTSKSGLDFLDELYASAPKTVDRKSEIGRVISDIQANADDWSGRVYKGNSKKIEIGGSVDTTPIGDFNPGHMSVSAINENKRNKRVDEMHKQILSLEKFMSKDNTEIDAILKDAKSRVPSIREWLGGAKNMTDRDIASMYINSEVLGIGNVYGEKTPGFKLLEGVMNK